VTCQITRDYDTNMLFKSSEYTEYFVVVLTLDIVLGILGEFSPALFDYSYMQIRL